MVPVLPKGELEVLLEAAIDLSKKGQMIDQKWMGWGCTINRNEFVITIKQKLIVVCILPVKHGSVISSKSPETLKI